ncbi:putative transcription factor p65 homolog [Saccostrea echinata]|uniref:putative transcription factor p65 homolog n=1 Tax=Saccostrea echinata TaxID=191078 RepID=UPI002A83C2BC|nr:putative transcription factor p65 homolog [Saccostrea echinata]
MAEINFGLENPMGLGSNDLSRLLMDGTTELLTMDPSDSDLVQQLIATQSQQEPFMQTGTPMTLNQTQPQKTPKQAGGRTSHNKTPDGIYVEITEQPKQRGLRFRYECEGRSAGSIPGENSTSEKKTFPTIKIHNYNGTAVIVVSCVTKDQPYEPHPHNLVGRDCKRGVCTLKVKDTNVISFPHLGIQCAKKKDVENNLKQRKEINVDPFQSGFRHLNKVNSIDLNVVRLCFQVFLPDESGKITRIVPPVVSHCIHDKKSLNELIICRVDRSSGKAKGGDEVFLLCEKINRDDIVVRFYEETEFGECLWEDFADFSTNDIHRQYAIVFRTPPYKDTMITRPKEVKMQLKRNNEPETSDPIPFIYMPEDPDPDRIMEKRKRKADQLKNWGFDVNVSGDDLKQRLKLKATKSRIKQEAPEVPGYSMENILGGGAHQMTATSSVTTTLTKDGTSLNVRTLDNTTMGSVTITPTDSVRQQLANLPDDVQNKLLQIIANRKLQEEATNRMNQSTIDTKETSAFIQNLIGGGLPMPPTSNPGQTPAQNILLPGGPALQQNSGMEQDNVDLMFQAYLGDQEQNMSFDSFGCNIGNDMNFDPNVAAMINVASDQGGMDETRAAVHSLNQS